ncbi:MAG: YceH family protein [Xanthomonadales bacterium]|nr:YceH family protein [Xanthomonadales bacterium]
MNTLSDIQIRVLGCLIEKKETTPEQYPLTLNGLRTACNQKTARNPVTAYTEGEVGHTVRELESLGLVREAWGVRVAKYEHLAGKVLNLPGKGLALLCPMMLRGPQTPGELKTNAHRLYAFDDLDDVQFMLQRLAEHEPPLVMALPRQPGQKEVRYVHLLSGEPDLAELGAQASATPAATGLGARVEALESAVASLQEELAELQAQLAPPQEDSDFA